MPAELSPTIFLCMDCSYDTLSGGEFYMVWDSIWEKACSISERSGMLCIGCLERRLNRKLSSFDFTFAPVNSGITVLQSKRLQNRLNN